MSSCAELGSAAESLLSVESVAHRPFYVAGYSLPTPSGVISPVSDELLLLDPYVTEFVPTCMDSPSKPISTALLQHSSAYPVAPPFKPSSTTFCLTHDNLSPCSSSSQSPKF